MSKFLSTKYKNLEAYVPGEQPKDMKYIKLNTNESPYPPSPETLDAVRGKKAELLNLYPDPTCSELKKAIAQRYGVNEENVFVSNGSDDILNFAFMAFGENGAVFPDITYGFYEVFCQLHKVQYKKIALKEDFSIDITEYMENGEMIAIANPNAPTGLLLTLDDIRKILKANPDNIVLIDEAYIDFGGESAVALLGEFSNLLVVQTFSKSRSLAGARLGFALADKEIIKDLEKIKYSTNPYSINQLTLAAGIAAIKSDEYYTKNASEVVKTREYTKKNLERLGFTVTNSYANFLFAKKDGVSGKEIYDSLREKGVLVRHFDKERIKDYNRITIGSFEEMKTFIKIIEEILEERK